jgi:16S rRNA (uracil1498-N3)-methyltransferase
VTDPWSALPLFVLADVESATGLTGSEGHHAATVRRIRPTERILLGDGEGRLALAEVTAVGDGEVRFRVVERRVEPAPSPRLVVVQALPKGERGELAVELLTEVGVDEIVPWAASRCVAVWRGQRADRGLGRWRATAREAGKQARRAYLPVVRELADLSEVCRRIAVGQGLVLMPTAVRPLAQVELAVHGEVLVIVGPEGGITDAERAELAEAGAVEVRLGPSVQRTSTAGASAAAVILSQTARWRQR